MSIDKTNPTPPKHPLKTGIAGKEQDLVGLLDIEDQNKPVKDLVDEVLSTGENEVTKSSLEKRREVKTA